MARSAIRFGSMNRDAIERTICLEICLEVCAKLRPISLEFCFLIHLVCVLSVKQFNSNYNK